MDKFREPEASTDDELMAVVRRISAPVGDAEILPTVKVRSADTDAGFIIINAADLTDDHELFIKPGAGPARAGNLK